MGAEHLILGLDGADLRIVNTLGPRSSRSLYSVSAPTVASARTR